MQRPDTPIYYCSKVALQSTSGLWLTVAGDGSVYLSEEEVGGYSWFTMYRLEDPHAVGPAHFQDNCVLQCCNGALLGTKLGVDPKTGKAGPAVCSLRDNRGAEHAGRWTLLHPHLRHHTSRGAGTCKNFSKVGYLRC